MKLHAVAILLFVIAIPCYFFSDKLGVALGFVGMILEILAWVLSIADDKEKNNQDTHD